MSQSRPGGGGDRADGADQLRVPLQRPGQVGVRPQQSPPGSSS
ncbi:hypothetical protein BN2537_12281 [Streptomyces venezuelae]|nr:hypothetical protein BN2537_12281 [Streptomyces venezuelae]